jgi:undecaprenyl-diphosphatase
MSGPFSIRGFTLSRNARTLLLMLMALVAAQAFLLLLLWLPGVQQFNIDLFLWVNQFYWSPLAVLTAFIELPAELFGVLFALILAYFGRYELAICILIAIAIEFVCVPVTKDITAMARPFVALNGIHAAYFPRDFSFPSGHAVGSFAVFSAWCFREKKHYVPLLGFAALIGFSRIYIGVHFPFDVIAGTVIGLIIGFYVARLDLTSVMHWLWARFGGLETRKRNDDDLQRR